MEIRPFRESDEAQVAAVWAAVFPEPSPRNLPQRAIEQKLAVQRELFFVAVLEGTVVGTAMGGYDGHRGWLYKLAVLPDIQGRGIGRALVLRVVAELKARGCPKMNLQVMASNAKVIAFYEKLGFAVEERISMGRLLA
jgi:ribosomal protein S18 acetylase RimI-like enzyme